MARGANESLNILESSLKSLRNKLDSKIPDETLPAKIKTTQVAGYIDKVNVKPPTGSITVTGITHENYSRVSGKRGLVQVRKDSKNGEVFGSYNFLINSTFTPIVIDELPMGTYYVTFSCETESIATENQYTYTYLETTTYSAQEVINVSDPKNYDVSLSTTSQSAREYEEVSVTIKIVYRGSYANNRIYCSLYESTVTNPKPYDWLITNGDSSGWAVISSGGTATFKAAYVNTSKSYTLKYSASSEDYKEYTVTINPGKNTNEMEYYYTVYDK